MIVEYIRYAIPVEIAPRFVAAYERAGAYLRRSEHCLGYELARCAEEEGAFILRIEWDSAEGHMEGFRKGPEFPGFLAEVRPFLSNIAEMRHYEVTAVRFVREGR